MPSIKFSTILYFTEQVWLLACSVLLRIWLIRFYYWDVHKFLGQNWSITLKDSDVRGHFIGVGGGGEDLIGNTQTLLYTVVRLFTNPAQEVAQYLIFAAQLLHLVPHVYKCVPAHKHRGQSGSKVTTEMRVLRTELASCTLSGV